MADEKKKEPEIREVVIDPADSKDVGQQAWLDALKELEAGAPPAKKPSPPAAAPRKKPAGRKPRNTPQGHAAEALLKVLDAEKKLEKFIEDYPYLMAPNVSRMLEDHLRETAVTLGRELQRRIAPGGGGTQ